MKKIKIEIYDLDKINKLLFIDQRGVVFRSEDEFENGGMGIPWFWASEAGNVIDVSKEDSITFSWFSTIVDKDSHPEYYI